MYASPPRMIEGLPQPGRTLVMGVVNVTPDSFSDGGRYLDTDLALRHGVALAEQGADLVDVGGESTRPGAQRCTEEEELARVVPVVRGLSDAGIAVSIDTMRAPVARACVEAGARLVNDVSGGRADDQMFATVAALEVPYVLMHWRAHSAHMQDHAVYDGPGGVVYDVRDELAARLRDAAEAGLSQGIAVDPGIGFAKTAEQNWELLGGLELFHELGHPLLVATSRKRFLGALLTDDAGERAAVERDDATTATTAFAAAAGAWCVRVHAVRAAADAVRVANRWALGAHRDRPREVSR